MTTRLAHELRQSLLGRLRATSRNTGAFRALFGADGVGVSRGIEALRQKVAAGDLSWVPHVRFVGERDLVGPVASFMPSHGLVCIDDALVHATSRVWCIALACVLREVSRRESTWLERLVRWVGRSSQRSAGAWRIVASGTNWLVY